jgi:pyruvate formate lyase activating enzyme
MMATGVNPAARADDAGLRARVINLQRMSTEDGPGIRTTVFLKGCSLACTWCHNPESLSPKPEVVWHDWKCIACASCDEVCPDDALGRVQGRIVIDRTRCGVDTWCANACPTTALEHIGTERGLDDLVAELAKDAAFFRASGGGVTASGGEPGVQARFVAALLRRCRALGIHAALDTSGMCAPTVMEEMTREADLVLYDIKEIDSERHRAFTGHPNERILANLVLVAERMRQEPLPSALWIRTPVIPGCTATAENVRGIGAFIAEHLDDVVERWDLCAFNNLAADKYRRLGRQWPFDGTPLMSAADLGALEAVARESGVRPEVVVTSGRVRLECQDEEAAA